MPEGNRHEKTSRASQDWLPMHRRHPRRAIFYLEQNDFTFDHISSIGLRFGLYEVHHSERAQSGGGVYNPIKNSRQAIQSIYFLLLVKQAGAAAGTKRPDAVVDGHLMEFKTITGSIEEKAMLIPARLFFFSKICYTERNG
jgi:hypothetical protein